MGHMEDFIVVVRGGGDKAVAAVQRAGDEWRAMLEQAADEIEALRLTDAERESLIVASIELNALNGFEEHHSHTLRKLLARCPATGTPSTRLTSQEISAMTPHATCDKLTADGQRPASRAIYYAWRAGYLEGALLAIASGNSGLDPQVAARRALLAVGEDYFLKEGSQPKTIGE